MTRYSIWREHAEGRTDRLECDAVTAAVYEASRVRVMQQSEPPACWHVWLIEPKKWLRQDERGRADSLPDAGRWTRKDAGEIVLHIGSQKADMVPDPYGPDAFVTNAWPTAEDWWP